LSSGRQIAHAIFSHSLSKCSPGNHVYPIWVIWSDRAVSHLQDRFEVRNRIGHERAILHDALANKAVVRSTKAPDHLVAVPPIGLNISHVQRDDSTICPR